MSDLIRVEREELIRHGLEVARRDFGWKRLETQQNPFAWDAEPWPQEAYSEPESPIYHLPALRQAWASRPLPAPADPLETEDDGQEPHRDLVTLFLVFLAVLTAGALFAAYVAEGLTR